MEKFFEKLSEMMTFENQVYLMVAVLFILLVLCFIMLLVVGIKYKKLNSLVEKMTDGSDDAEDVPETISKGLENAGEAAAEEETDDSGTKEAAASAEAEQADGAAEPEPEEAGEDAGEEAAATSADEAGEEAENDIAEEPEEPSEVQNGEPSEESAAEDSGKKELDEVYSRIFAMGEEIAAIRSQNEAFEEKLTETTAKQRKAFDKIKVVRYNATLPGGDTVPGYSIGITNQDSEGVVLTGITAAEGGTALEVKSIRNGKGNVELTPAEECAVTRKTKE